LGEVIFGDSEFMFGYIDEDGDCGITEMAVILHIKQA
jgi:hypothetical protein